MTANDDRGVINWLLASSEPAIRRLARRQLHHQSSADEEARLLEGPIVRALFDGQMRDGGFGVHPYAKWRGAHWRLVALVELGIPVGEPRAMAATDTVLAWLTDPSHRRVPVIEGRARRCASQEGNALAVACRLGMADDPRVALLATSLIGWQWPDGGWNCDRRPEARRSSFHEALPPIWGLHEFAAATGDAAAADAARRGAELLLTHHVFRTLRTGDPIHPEWLKLHWPPYWHYDVLQALVVLRRLGLAADPRTADASAILRARRRRDGHWKASDRWWNPPGYAGRAVEAVDWHVDDAADRLVTLRALTVLHA